MKPLPLRDAASQVWRGEHFSCKRSEYNSVKRQLHSETFGSAAAAGGEGGGGKGEGEGGAGALRTWNDLDKEEQGRLLKDRLKKYCQKVGGAGFGNGTGDTLGKVMGEGCGWEACFLENDPFKRCMECPHASAMHA